MRFCDELNNYINLLNCSQKDLCEISGLSPTIISRYLSNKRTPKIDSEYFDKIVDSLYQIAREKNISLRKEEISNTFKKCLTSNDVNFEIFANNFNTLLNELKINSSDLANFIGYDISFISRIKSKDRKPSDLDALIDATSNYIISTYTDSNSKNILANLLHLSTDTLADNEYYKNAFIHWITTSHDNDFECVKNFLLALNAFDLNEFLSKNVSNAKISTSPFISKSSKALYNVEGKLQAEREFLKTTFASKSNEPLFYYSNLPMLPIPNEYEAWISSMPKFLKKGLHINIIHDIDKPIDEIFLELTNWIPVYISGSISAYYIKMPPSVLFYESLYTSGSVALSGEYIQSNNVGKFYLTSKADEIAYYKGKVNYILSASHQLMSIIKEDSKFNNFMKQTENEEIIKIQKEDFKNIDFCINKNKWLIINKYGNSNVHLIIYNYKLINAIQEYLEKN